MQSRTLALILLSAALGACSDSADGTGADGDAKALARAQVEDAMRDQAVSSGATAPAALPTAAGNSGSARDVCQDHKWYGDGECDAWCPQGDAKDCAPSTGGVACAEFFSPADGFCNRNDPCAPLQDEDCQKNTDPGEPGCTPPHPTPHAPDGNVSSPVVCDAIAYPANGKCEAPPGCEANDPKDCKAQVACILILYPQNGKCEAAPGCEASDPDC